MKCAWTIPVACCALLAQPQAPPKGTVEGQVVNAKTGAPLKKAAVRLNMIMPPGSRNAAPVPGAANGAIAMPVQPTMRSVDTDDQGRFTFTGLDAGKYRLSAERQGFLRQSYGQRKYSGGGSPILVSDGQTVKGLLFKLNPQGVITGKVLDEDGEPLAGVQVRAMRNMYSNGKRQWMQVGNGNSSDIGEYRLPDLQPGRYLVSTSPRNTGRNMPFQANEPLTAAPDMTYAATYYPNTTDAAAASPIDVTPGGEIRGIDVRLIKTRVWRVRGTVAGAADAPRRGAVQVALVPADGPSNGQLQSGTRQPDGQFEIRNVPSGSYMLMAFSMGGAQGLAAAMPVTVTGSHVEGLRLILAAGAEMQGTVKLVDAAAPVELKNVNVMLQPARNLYFGGGPPPRGRVGDDMKFTLKGVGPIPYKVNVTGVPNTCYLKSVLFNGADVPADGADLSAGGTIDVVISAAAAQVDAVVMDGDNKPVAGAVVAVIPKDGSRPQVMTADDSGILSVKGLKPGDYRLVAWEDVEQGALYDPDFLRQFDKEGKSVKLDASGHEALQLKAIPADDK
jgi:uncharacterized surface anchored protein